MSDTAAAEPTTATPAIDPEAMGGDVSDILEALNLEPEADGAGDGSEKAGHQPFAEKKDKAEKADAKGDADEKTEKTKTDDESDNWVEELKAVRQRAAEKKRARETQRTQAAKPATPAAEPSKKPETVEAKPADVPKPANAEERAVAKVMSDVLAEIAALTAEDNAAAAKPADEASKAAAAERAADLKKLRETVEALGKKLEDSEALKAKYGELEAKIQEMTARREIESKIDRALEAHSDKLPTLMAKRDSVSLVYAAAEKFYQKTGVLPDFRFVAERLERVMSRHEKQQNGEGQERAPAKGKETSKAAPRKTVSSSLETPPSSRRSPDSRTKEEVEADLYASLGLGRDD